MSGLLAHLVQGVGEAGIGDVGAERELVGEARHQNRLEEDAEPHDRGQLLAGEGDALVGREVEVEAVDREQLVGEYLALCEAAGDLDVGLDDPAARRSVEPLDPGVVVGVGNGGRRSHGHDSKENEGMTQSVISCGMMRPW